MEEKKEKEYVEAEIVRETVSKTGDFAFNFADEKFKDFKKAILLKGGFYLAFWILIALLIIAGFLALLFWILPPLLFFIFSVFILGLIINLVVKIYSIFKK